MTYFIELTEEQRSKVLELIRVELQQTTDSTTKQELEELELMFD